MSINGHTGIPVMAAVDPLQPVASETLTLQTSDGEIHTIVLTSEQLAELGLQVQYPPAPVVTDPMPLQNIELVSHDNTVISDPIPNSIGNISTLKSVRLSNIKVNGSEFQLVSDKLTNACSSKILNGFNDKPILVTNPNETVQMDVDEPMLNANDLSIPLSTAVASLNGLPIKNGPALMTPSIADARIMNDASKNLHRTTLNGNHSSRTLNNHITKKDSTKEKCKIFSNISVNLLNDQKRNLNLRTSLTPIPLALKPPKKMLIQPETCNDTGWNKGSTHQTVYVLQSGDQYHSVEKLDGEKLRVVTDAVNSVGARPENKNNVLFDPVSKTRILYRVLNPEDLNLYNPNDEKNVPHQAPTPRKLMSKKVSQIVSVTRSGRCVRPPRHMTADYEPNNTDKEENSIADMIPEPIFETPVAPANKSTPKQRFSCPLCHKSYNGSKRMGKHLATFPAHAINEKSAELLKRFKSENQPKKPPSADAESQTDFPLVDAVNIQPPVTKKDAMTDGVNINTYREREERNLFKSLIRILQRTAAECRAYVFVRQLAILTLKLRKLLPCLMNRTEFSSVCSINEPVGKILNLTPGKYHFDMDAIHCAKAQNGTCKHIKKPPIENIIPNQTPIPYEPWINNMKAEKCPKEDKNPLTKCARTNPVDKWNSNMLKQKWIPIGSGITSNETVNSNDDNWMPTTCEVLVNNTTFTQSEESIKTWETSLHERNVNNENAANSPWMSNTINELSKINMSQELNQPDHLLNSSQSNMLSSSISSKTNGLNFNCKDKLVNLHAELVYGMEKDLLEIKNGLSCASQPTCVNESTEPGNFDFNESHFDMQMDSDKLNFTSAQYNEMKYGRGTLPPFRKIETSKNIPLPVDALGDISSDADKLHLPTDDPILNGDSYPITSESLDLSIDASHQINVLNTCKTGSLNSGENAIHCSRQTLLESADLNLPISVSNTLDRNEALLSVSESSLDGTRLNLSTSQSVLNLLDPLGTDCLSFSDSELNPRTAQMSLDLQLDLFPFHHP